MKSFAFFNGLKGKRLILLLFCRSCNRLYFSVVTYFQMKWNILNRGQGFTFVHLLSIPRS